MFLRVRLSQRFYAQNAQRRRTFLATLYENLRFEGPDRDVGMIEPDPAPVLEPKCLSSKVASLGYPFRYLDLGIVREPSIWSLITSAPPLKTSSLTP